MFIALIFIPASVYQMTRGIIVFITAMMSIIFLKKKLHRQHWTALTCIVGGVAIVGVAVSLFSHGGDANEYNLPFGITLMVIAQLFHGGAYVVEEKFFGDHYIHPFYLVGWEGIWGLCFYAVFLTIVQFIPCHSKLFCPYGHLEDTVLAVR